jgi:PKD repeat protein
MRAPGIYGDADGDECRGLRVGQWRDGYQVVTVNGPQAAFYSVQGGNVVPLGSTAVFANTSNVYGDAAGDVRLDFWRRGDFDGLSPAHLYAQPGTYTVTLTAQDAAGGVCRRRR